MLKGVFNAENVEGAEWIFNTEDTESPEGSGDALTLTLSQRERGLPENTPRGSHEGCPLKLAGGNGACRFRML